MPNQEHTERIKKSETGSMAIPAKNLLLCRATQQSEPVGVPPIVHEVLRSPGQPLDKETRAFFEPCLGHDFNPIPVHPKAPARFQAKLAINSPGDIYEQEADRVADQVLSAPTHSGVNGATSRIQRYAEQATEGADAAPASVDRVLASSGRLLDPAIQQDMRQRFGHDFSRVRVHSGAAAEQSARDVNAHAYTVRHNIVFGAGQHAPSTPRGLHLLVHELAHVLQQSASNRSTDLTVDGPGSPLELHADQMVAQVMAGGGLQRGSARSASPGLVLRHAADKTICPPPPLYIPISAKPKEVYGPANEAIEQAYINDPRHKNQAVLTGSQFEYGGNKEIRLPKSTPDRKASDAILSRLRGLVKQRAPDIMNFTERVFYEIKTPDFAVDGMVKLGSYYALTDVIRMELGEQGGPPWDQGAATWYPPHVLPFPGNLRRLICTQMTEYSITTPGLILYMVLERQSDKEKKKKKVQEVAKPEQEQKEEKKKAPPQPKPEGEVDEILPKVIFGVGGAALTAATIAYLRKRAIEQAERRAAQLAWRKMAEAAAARRAAQVAGKGAAGKVAGKAVGYAEIAAAAALIIFYADRVEAKPGPGPSAIESLYKAMTTSGTPPSPELKKLIENDPLLKQLAEEAAGSGDPSPLQEEMTRRTLELIHDNPDVFTPEDLEFMMQYAKTAKVVGQAPQTVEQLRKAIDAAKVGKGGGGLSPGTTAGAGSGGPSVKKEDSGGAKAEQPGQAGAPLPSAPPKTPEESLVEGMARKEPDGPKFSPALKEKLLATARAITPPLTYKEVDDLLMRLESAVGKSEEEIVESLRKGVAALRTSKGGEAGPTAPEPAEPGEKPAKAPSEVATDDVVKKAKQGKKDPVLEARLEKKLGWIEAGRIYVAGSTDIVFEHGKPFTVSIIGRDKAGSLFFGSGRVTPRLVNGTWQLAVPAGIKLSGAAGHYGVTQKFSIPAFSGVGTGKKEKALAD